MIIIVSDDPDDARRVRRALQLLERSLRLNGARLPGILREPVVRAGVDWGGLEGTSLGDQAAPDQSPAMPPLLLDVVESARALRCSTKTVARLIAQGELPAVQLGRRRLVRPLDLQEYVDRLAAGPDRAAISGGDAA